MKLRLEVDEKCRAINRRVSFNAFVEAIVHCPRESFEGSLRSTEVLYIHRDVHNVHCPWSFALLPIQFHMDCLLSTQYFNTSFLVTLALFQQFSVTSTQNLLTSSKIEALLRHVVTSRWPPRRRHLCTQPSYPVPDTGTGLVLYVPILHRKWKRAHHVYTGSSRCVRAFLWASPQAQLGDRRRMMINPLDGGCRASATICDERKMDAFLGRNGTSPDVEWYASHH